MSGEPRSPVEEALENLRPALLGIDPLISYYGAADSTIAVACTEVPDARW